MWGHSRFLSKSKQRSGNARYPSMHSFSGPCAIVFIIILRLHSKTQQSVTKWSSITVEQVNNLVWVQTHTGTFCLSSACWIWEVNFNWIVLQWHANKAEHFNKIFSLSLSVLLNVSDSKLQCSSYRFTLQQHHYILSSLCVHFFTKKVHFQKLTILKRKPLNIF